jgi:hypothetical protein
MAIALCFAVGLGLISTIIGWLALLQLWALRSTLHRDPASVAQSTAVEARARSLDQAARERLARASSTKTIDDPQEPYLALDNMGAFYAILLPEEVEAARKAGRQIISFTPLSEQETKIAHNNLLNAALESMPAIEDEGPISGEIGPSPGGCDPAAS